MRLKKPHFSKNEKKNQKMPSLQKVLKIKFTKRKNPCADQYITTG